MYKVHASTYYLIYLVKKSNKIIKLLIYKYIMNTHSNFYKPNAKLPLGKEMRLLTNDSQPRVKTSGSPNRMPLIKEYGQTGNAALANNFATTRQSQNLHLVSIFFVIKI